VTKPKPLFEKNFLRTPKEDMTDSGSEGWLCLSQEGYGQCSPNNIAQDANTLVTMHLMQRSSLSKFNQIDGHDAERAAACAPARGLQKALRGMRFFVVWQRLTCVAQPGLWSTMSPKLVEACMVYCFVNVLSGSGNLNNCSTTSPNNILW